MIANNENLPFGNNIKEHNEVSTRILFTNSKGLYLCTDTHRIIELIKKIVSKTTLTSFTSLKQLLIEKTKERLTYFVKPSLNNGKQQW